MLSYGFDLLKMTDLRHSKSFYSSEDGGIVKVEENLDLLSDKNETIISLDVKEETHKSNFKKFGLVILLISTSKYCLIAFITLLII